MKLIFSGRSWADYTDWQQADPKIAARLNGMIQECMRHPFQGIGKPEPLRGDLSGWWSRGITDDHRLVYRVSGKGNDQALEIAACRLHYSR